jgi:hypothetical protein
MQRNHEIFLYGEEKGKVFKKKEKERPSKDPGRRKTGTERTSPAEKRCYICATTRQWTLLSAVLNQSLLYLTSLCYI